MGADGEASTDGVMGKFDDDIASALAVIPPKNTVTTAALIAANFAFRTELDIPQPPKCQQSFMSKTNP